MKLFLLIKKNNLNPQIVTDSECTYICICIYCYRCCPAKITIFNLLDEFMSRKFKKKT